MSLSTRFLRRKRRCDWTQPTSYELSLKKCELKTKLTGVTAHHCLQIQKDRFLALDLVMDNEGDQVIDPLISL